MTLLRPDSDKSEHRDYEGQAKVAVAYSAGTATKVRPAAAKHVVRRAYCVSRKAARVKASRTGVYSFRAAREKMGRFCLRYFLSKFEPTHSPCEAPAGGVNSISSKPLSCSMRVFRIC